MEPHYIAVIFIIILTVAIFVEVRNIIPDNGNRERSVIAELLAKGYKFVLPHDYFNGVNYTKTAILIHDIDFNINGLNKFMQIENSYGVKSCFLPRWSQLNEQVTHELIDAQNQGFEIGFQYECLSASNGNFTHAYELFNQQITVMKNIFNVSTTDYHGDVNKPDINNFDLYNQTLWHSLGLNEIYSLNFSYYTDTSNHLIIPVTLGPLVVIQLHTDWTI
jgi:hypothetical protein